MKIRKMEISIYLSIYLSIYIYITSETIWTYPCEGTPRNLFCITLVVFLVHWFLQSLSYLALRVYTDWKAICIPSLQCLCNGYIRKSLKGPLKGVHRNRSWITCVYVSHMSRRSTLSILGLWYTAPRSPVSAVRRSFGSASSFIFFATCPPMDRSSSARPEKKKADLCRSKEW